TTPNVDSLPARGKLLLKGKIRAFDGFGDPTHISPIFWDLLAQKYLPSARLSLAKRLSYPMDGFRGGRPIHRFLLAPISRAMRGSILVGDVHVLVLRRDDD